MGCYHVSESLYVFIHKVFWIILKAYVRTILVGLRDKYMT